MKSFSSVFITGATGGLGRALAQKLATPGTVLYLTGRKKEELKRTADECRRRGAEVFEYILDTDDAEALDKFFAGVDRLDLVIANAGVSGGGGGQRESSRQVRRIFKTNIDGTLNTILPAMDKMAGQAPGQNGVRGQIAVIASIAGFVSAPGSPSYCATKAALDRFTVATSKTAKQQGILLSSVCPGYIKTAMTVSNGFAMPGITTPDKAAEKIIKGLKEEKLRITFPLFLFRISRLLDLFYPKVFLRLLGKAQAKKPLREEQL